jgi:glycosyltransferase involved in cell wall biosynthesis
MDDLDISKTLLGEPRLGFISDRSETGKLALSVVAPCYNEAPGLREFHQRVSAACRAEVGEGYEIVLVNDGSRDGTWSVMGELAGSDRHVVAVNLSRNHGHQLALTAGLQFTRGNRILIIDADLQDPPELLHQMMCRMDEGADVVYGQREMREGETWFKRASASLFYLLLQRLVEIDIPRNTGDFRLMSRSALSVLNTMPERDRFVRGMVSWIGMQQVPIRYNRAPRFAGTGNYPFRKMFRFALDAVTGFSTRPLRIASYLGAISGLFGLVLIAYIAFAILTQRAVAGWASVMATMVVLGSSQLFILGIIGEYLGRLYLEAKGRPLFVVSEILTAAELRARRQVSRHAVDVAKVENTLEGANEPRRI